VEFTFDPSIRPLDLALSRSCRELYYTFETGDFKKRLAVISIKNDDTNRQPVEIFASEGDIRGLICENGRLWFAAEKDFYTTQLFSINTDANTVEKFTQLPGGVWDVSFADDKIELVTLDMGEFWKTSIARSPEFHDSVPLPASSTVVVADLKPVKSTGYHREYHTSYWTPLLSEDEDGFVFGIYSYRTDRLGRSSIVVAPTYGVSSQNVGYQSVYMQRFGLFKVTASVVDQVRKKSYLATDFFERSMAKVLDVQYPLNLSTTMSVGMDLTKRGIAEIPQNGAPLPTVGRDHSFYANINHRAIRTEPYWKVFPRRGRTVTASYKRGNEFLDGDMNYDSMSLRWNEYFPLRSDWVLTARTWLAEDDKENNIRRPDDLSLGGIDYMRGYDGAFKSGDKLRTFALHLGHPVDFKFPRFMSWVFNEFMIAEVFWEMGDVNNQGGFNWRYDRGIELRSQILLFKRIPLIVRVGAAMQNGSDKTNTYFAVDASDLGEVFQ
ncbi:MAG: hypothetical protein PHV05_05325, partial [Candidatus Riflebacteria bacterium]|nr:hypothetical protein [Candidatus Riflebacteria bacterium]